MLRWFTLRPALVVLGIVLMTTTSPARISDSDYDGIDDGLEAQLAAQFLPEMRYAHNEWCAAPNYPGPVLFRARYGTRFGDTYTNVIIINYIRLYQEDCGDLGSHQGDNEAFMVYLELVNGTWTFSSVQAAAHANTLIEASSASYDPLLWISRGKHGTFADLSVCDANFSLADDDHCDWNGPTYPHTLYNVGEPVFPLLENLGDINSNWDGEFVWNDYIDGKFLDAGSILNGLYTDLFNNAPQLTLVPGYTACQSTCQAATKQCIMENSFEYCQSELSICQHSCDIYHLSFGPQG